MKFRVYLLALISITQWGVIVLNAHSQSGQASSFLSVADSLMDYSDFKRASQYYLDAIRISEKDEDWEMSVKAWNGLGYCQTRLNLPQEAEKTLTKSLEIALSELGLQNAATADSYENLGFFYYWNGPTEKALEFTLKALNLRRDLYGEKVESVARSYWILGNVYRFNLFQHIENPKRPQTEGENDGQECCMVRLRDDVPTQQ